MYVYPVILIVKWITRVSHHCLTNPSKCDFTLKRTVAESLPRDVQVIGESFREVYKTLKT